MIQPKSSALFGGASVFNCTMSFGDDNFRLQRCKTVNDNIYIISRISALHFLPRLILVFDPYLFFESVET